MWTVLPKADVTEFAYDASGDRVKKVSAGITTLYIGNLFEKTSSLTTKHIYLYAGTVPVRVVSKASQGTVPEVFYYHSDHLGSSNVITDQNANQVQMAEYRPFGSFSRQSPITTVTNYLFTGKELDKATGLYYYGARY